MNMSRKWRLCKDENHDGRSDEPDWMRREDRKSASYLYCSADGQGLGENKLASEIDTCDQESHPKLPLLELHS